MDYLTTAFFHLFSMFSLDINQTSLQVVPYFIDQVESSILLGFLSLIFKLVSEMPLLLHFKWEVFRRTLLY